MVDTQLTLAGSRLPNVGTQQRRILDMLVDRRWVCGQEFSDEFGWAFGSRISDLRARGFALVERPVTHPNHRPQGQGAGHKEQTLSII